jgi:ribonucleoside-triphosphate reductase
MQQINILDEISNYIITSKYARYNEKKQRRETWTEIVNRVEAMHLKRFKKVLPSERLEEIKWAFSLVRDKKICPSMRSMQFGGKAIETKNARMFNCAVLHVDSLRSFAESFFLLLCGCGVGFGLSPKYLGRLPNLVNADDKTGTVVTYVVEDTIEGWADSVEALLMCYFKNTPYTGRKITFDYSRIRKKGAKLKTTGGKAPGYKGLKSAHKKIKELLDHVIEDLTQSRLKSTNAYDILMHCADAVLSGGVRRSACSVIFPIGDEDMINAKINFKVDKFGGFHFSHDAKVGGKIKKYYSGKVWLNKQIKEVEIEDWELKQLEEKGEIGWKPVEPQRARSNNSVLLLRDKVTKDEFAAIIERTKQWGEPGFVWADDEDTLFNPCFEVGFVPVTKDGRCGVQFCNLTTTNGAKVKTVEDFKQCVIAQAIIGTLQASYTDFPYLSLAAKELTEDEALLGCSITAMMMNPQVLLNPHVQREMAQLSVDVNKKWAELIKINQAARVTVIKPEGTSTKALGSLFSGIHAGHSRKQFLNVQANKEDNIYKFFKIYNEHLIEPSVWSANKTDDCICFPVENPEGAIYKSDLTAIQHLEYIKSTQQNWVIPGTTQANKKNLSHNVSCTVIVKDSEWQDVIDYIFLNRRFFAAVSFIPDYGDKIYPQAPNIAITTQEDEKRFDELLAAYEKVDYTKLEELDDETHMVEEAACVGGKCDIV